VSYGLITETDGRALERSLMRTARRFRCESRGEPLRIVEIGVCHGDTARGIKAFLDAEGVAFEYVGLDNNRDLPVAVPFEGAQLIVGDSAETYRLLPWRPHWIFCDGCHAANAVMLDFLNFGDQLLPGGELIFHDAAPYTQRKLDWQGMGPKDHVDFGTATRTAARRLGLLDGARSDWSLVEQTWEPSWDSGGTIVAEKLRDATDPVMP